MESHGWRILCIYYSFDQFGSWGRPYSTHHFFARWNHPLKWPRIVLFLLEGIVSNRIYRFYIVNYLLRWVWSMNLKDFRSRLHCSPNRWQFWQTGNSLLHLTFRSCRTNHLRPGGRGTKSLTFTYMAGPACWSLRSFRGCAYTQAVRADWWIMRRWHFEHLRLLKFWRWCSVCFEPLWSSEFAHGNCLALGALWCHVSPDT